MNNSSASEPAPPRRSWPRRFLNRLEVDQATFYAVALRGWQLVAGLVSVLLISRCFSPELQGYYYTFYAVLALQTFFELGLQIVVLNAASHEWAGLSRDAQGRIVGQSAAYSRLVSLGRWIAWWYGAVSGLFVVAVGCGGCWFFSRAPSPDIAWLSPWLTLVLLSGMLLWTLPFSALLEGCNQVTTVNRFRLIQAVCANLVVWTAIAWGAGLWTAPATMAARLLCDLYLLGVHSRRFFGAFWRTPTGPTIDWRKEIWPMQWRLAVSGVVSYFEFFLYTPIMFHYRGDVVAGQMGMTWSLLMAMQAGALAWVQARAPLFGRLVARRDFRELDRVYFRLTTISVAVLALGAVIAESCVWGLHASGHPLAARLLPPLPTGAFLLAIVLYQLPHCQSIYLRAHKREPLLVANVIACLSIGLLVWLLGSHYGPTGAAGGYLAVVALFILPYKTYLWWRCRRDWHQ